MALTDKLTNIADAIRGKTGGTDALTLDAMATEIEGISTGVDTSDATAEAGDILAGETAYVNGVKVTGNIPSQAAKTITPSSTDQTAIEANTYAAGAVTVTGDANLTAENIAEGVSIFGVEGTHSGGGDTSTEDGLITGAITECRNNKVTNVRGYAFYACRNLAEIDLPLATSVGDQAFNNCSALTTANLPLVESIGQHGFSNCKALRAANFPSADNIANGAFNSCTSLETASFPKVTSVAGSMFSYCSSLTAINFPLATSIEGNSFISCTKLKTADFPLVTSIGYSVFAGCSELVVLVIRQANSVCSLSSTNALTNTPIQKGTGYIYVSDALVEDYKTATNWSTFADQIKPLSEYVEVSA